MYNISRSILEIYTASNKLPHVIQDYFMFLFHTYEYDNRQFTQSKQIFDENYTRELP